MYDFVLVTGAVNHGSCTNMMSLHSQLRKEIHQRVVVSHLSEEKI